MGKQDDISGGEREMGRQRRDMDVLLGERTTEWVGVCGQGTGRCVII